MLKWITYSCSEGTRLVEPKGSVMTIAFELDGQKFSAINGGPYVTINDAISFVVNCESQDEIDWLSADLCDCRFGNRDDGIPYRRLGYRRFNVHLKNEVIRTHLDIKRRGPQGF